MELREKIANSFKTIINLAPENCTDILINPNKTVFMYSSDGKYRKENIDLNFNSLLCTLTMLAGLNNKILDEKNPSFSAIIPNLEYRIEVLIPPVVENITIAIRIPNRKYYSLEKLVELEMLKNKEKQKIEHYIQNKKNIIISGETSSGKTTLLNAMINKIQRRERLVIIEEETSEIRPENENVVSIVTDRKIFTNKNALRVALRLNPNRIIYSESRDGESALEMLKSWRTGHNGGITTIHASGVDKVKKRLEDLLREVCQSPMNSLIDDVVDVAIHLEIENGKRFIKEIKEFK